MKKGNLVVGQSGGCTAVINQTLAGVIEGSISNKNVGKVFGMRNGIVGLLKDDLVDLTKLTKKQLATLKQTPSSALGSCRHKLSDSECDVILKQLKKHDIRYFLLIGGNDTAMTTVRVAEYARANGYSLNAIAVPKTIDNDLPFMDHTPGYGSAATFIASTTQEAGKDTESMKLVDPIKIIEVMGRNSGWLVASSALAKRDKKDAPHLMYLPENPFSVKQFLDDVENVYSRIGYCVVIISETIRDADGKRIGERNKGITKDSFGHLVLNSAAAQLAELAEEKLGVRARYEKPGSIQRMSMNYISRVDQKESWQVGKRAVDLAAKGESEVMVTLERVSKAPYRFGMSCVPATKIAGVEKYMPKAFINKKGNFVTKAFYDYALPLVGPLPDFIRL